MRDLIGRTLGHYRIVEKIGEGGMGEVYRAHDERLDRDVAVKVLPEEVAKDRDRLARFEREAKTVAALSHPNILEIHDFDTEGGVTFAVTELLEGETLREHLQKLCGPLPWKRVQEIGGAVADGLGAAHGKGVVHRDIKPSNIFLCSDDRVKILDFGLAATHEMVDSEAETGSIEAPLTQKGSVMGTVGYMAPEQVRGELTDHRSDIFALGCVLYEMLTGERAFKRDAHAETMAAILYEEPPPFAETGVQVPPGLEKTVNLCLEKEPDDRYQSATDVALSLGSGSDIAPSPIVVGETHRLRTWAMPLLAIAGILVVALGMVFGPGILERLGGQPEQPLIRSIAILPLENLTGDPEQQYLVDGLHDEMIATFAQISGFDKVIARSSVMVFRDSDTPIRDIGKELDVEAVIEGSVRRWGNRVRVTVQLINTRTESYLWADSFEHDLADILVLQSDVARAVANEVRMALTLQEAKRLAQTRPIKQEAYEVYLKAMDLIRSGRAPQDTLMEAIGLFEMAVEIDPTFAPAYIGLSRSYQSLAVRYRPPIEMMPKAQDAVSKALELNEALPQAHAYLGHIKWSWQWDWPGAEAEFRRALKLDPNDVEAMYGLANFLGCVGRSGEAIEIQRRAAELSPLDLRMSYGLGWTYWAGRRFDESILQFRKTIELHPEAYWPHVVLAWNYGNKGLYDDGLEELKKAAELEPAAVRDPFFWMSATWLHAVTGRTIEANDALERLLALREDGYLAPTYVAYAYTGLGDFDRAIEFLERAFEARHVQIACLAIPVLDPLRGDPRFQDILRRMNFPEN